MTTTTKTQGAYSALTPGGSLTSPPSARNIFYQTAHNLPSAISLPDSDDGTASISKWTKFKQSVAQFVTRNTGLLLVAASQVFFACMAISVKFLNDLDTPVPTLELIVVRMVITWVCCVSYMVWTGVPNPFIGPKGIRHLLVFRGFSGFFGLFGLYYSLQYLSVSDAVVLTFLAPLCTGIVGWLLLKEPLTRRELFAGVCSLFGVVLIARPPLLFGHAVGDNLPTIPTGREVTSTQRLIAVGVSMIGVCGATGAYVTIRTIGKRAHPLHSITFFSSQCVVAGVVGMAAIRQQPVIPTQLDWLLLLILIGIFGFLAQALLTMGLQRETAGRGTIGVYSQIVFASILEYIFFKPKPSVLSLLGTLLIVSSAIYIAVTKQTAPTNSKVSSVPPVQSAGIRKPEVQDREASALEEGLLLHTEEVGQHSGVDPDTQHEFGTVASHGRSENANEGVRDEDEYSDGSDEEMEAGNALHEANVRSQT